MARRKSLRKIVDELVAQFIPEIRAAFLAAMQDIVDNAILKDVADAILEGDPEKAFRALGMSDSAMRPITAVIERAYETGGITVGQTFPKYLNTSSGRAVFRFDVRNSRAEKFLRERSSQLVTSIMTDTREAMRNVLTEGVALGRNPKTISLDIVGRINPISGKREGGIIGLTPGQERWSANVRRDLVNLDKNYFNRKLRNRKFDSIVHRAINSGEKLSNDQVEKLVTSYRNRALKYRGDVIGRTEAIQSLNTAKHEAFQQAVDLGAVKPNGVKRVWDSSGDDGHTRDTHLQMEGQTVELNEPFTFPDGSQAMYPGDGSLGAPPEEIIQCRCGEDIDVNWLEGVT